MPAEELTAAAGLALRLLGGFYALGALFGLRRLAMDMLLTQALAAIARPDPRETRAETRRAWFLASQLMLVGVVGLALMALLDLALPLMLVSAGVYALYLFVLAPRLFDPFDPPEEPGRGQTWRAFWLYLAAAALVGLAGWGGVLRPVRDEPWPVLALVALLAVGLVGYGVRLIRRMQEVAGIPAPTSEELALEHDTEIKERLRATPLILSPSWNEGVFFDARTREPIFGRLPSDLLPWEDDEDLNAWQNLFLQFADPDDPERRRFQEADHAARLEAEGRPIFERLAARMAPGQLTFEPVPWPRFARREAKAVKLMAEAGTDPLWVTSGGIHEPVYPHGFGLSWNLGADLCRWAADYDASIDWDDPAAPPGWGEAGAAAHEAEGRALAVRLVRELAATGRGHVRVTFWSEREQAAIPIQG